MPSMPRSERMQVVPFQRPYRCRHRLCIPCRYPLRQPNPAPRRPAFQNRRLGDTDPRPGGRSLRREHLHLPAHIGDYNGDRERGIFRSRWAIISQDGTFSSATTVSPTPSCSRTCRVSGHGGMTTATCSRCRYSTVCRQPPGSKRLAAVMADGQRNAASPANTSGLVILTIRVSSKLIAVNDCRLRQPQVHVPIARFSFERP